LQKQFRFPFLDQFDDFGIKILSHR
jgi:hypothetical protein